MILSLIIKNVDNGARYFNRVDFVVRESEQDLIDCASERWAREIAFKRLLAFDLVGDADFIHDYLHKTRTIPRLRNYVF